MKAEPAANEPRGRRLRLLLSAYACNPYKGSDAGEGWNRAREAARLFDTWVICGHWDQVDISHYLAKHGEIPGLHFCFVAAGWFDHLLKARQPLYYANYLHYNLWQRRAFHLGTQLHREVKFALIHHAILVGFREPGYLWKLGVPFIWGPMGGTQNYPWRFLPLAGVRGALLEGVRSLINLLHLRFSPRVRRAVRKAALLVAANTQVQRDFVRVHGVKPRLLLDPGINETAAAGAKTFNPDAPLRLLWSGSFEHRKALPLLLKALAGLPSDQRYELTILGAGPAEGRWRRLARSLGLEEHCRWLGWLPLDQALKHYDGVDVLVFTSLRDTSGNVVLEALSRGVPVICLDHQGAGDMVTSGCGFKIPVTTPHEVIRNLRQILSRLADNKQELYPLSAGAVERARDFLWSRNADQMAEFYQEALVGQADPQTAASRIPKGVSKRK